MTALRFAELTSPAVARLRESGRRTVLLLPVDAVEPHGPHAPLATDALISDGLCLRAARALAGRDDLRALVLPGIAYGVTRCAGDLPGTIGIGDEALHAIVVDVCAAAHAQGFSELVLVNSHLEPEHVATLRRAVATLERRDGWAPAHLDVTRRAQARRLPDEFRRGSCHAGRYETSLVLADRPELVDVERMATLPAREVAMPAELAAGRTSFAAMGMDDGYCGDPAAATAAEGAETFATLTALLLELIEGRG